MDLDIDMDSDLYFEISHIFTLTEYNRVGFSDFGFNK